jgi:predicted flap endonuclease-1-like 5' DNA nuclease
MAGVAEIVAVTAQDEVEEVEARAAEMEVVPEVEAAPAPVAAGDDLSKIKGLGPKLQKLLPELGLTTYAQIAALTDADLDALDAKLGAFAGRPRRDAWVDQAKLLASGDVGGFEGKFGKL